MVRTAFIINPNSSNGNYKPIAEKIKKKCNNPLIYISKSKYETEVFVKNNFEKIDVFIAIGGDGTISSVAKLLIYSTKILGVYPSGSGNGFAKETHFTKNIEQLFKKIKLKKYTEIDTISINGKLSINISGVGFDAAVVQNFERTSRGFINYIKTTIYTFFQYKESNIQFEERFENLNGNYLMINFANTRQFGNNAFIAPNANYKDGKLEIALVKKNPIYLVPIFIFRLFSKKLKENKYLKYISTSEIYLKSCSDIWHIDGEFEQIKSPVHIKILPKSLKILS